MVKPKKPMNSRSVTLTTAMLMFTCTLAPAVADIGQSDLATISSAVAQALQTASSVGPSAEASALQPLIQADIGQYGPDNQKEVAATIIADALADGSAADSVGKAMAQAALALGKPASLEIAQAVGECGNPEVLAAFEEAVRGQPGGDELADEAENSTTNVGFENENPIGGVAGAAGNTGGNANGFSPSGSPVPSGS